MKKHNFSAGPAILPASVMEEAAKAAVNLDEIGLSVMEISHRSAEFDRILNEAIQLVREVLKIGDDYAVLFLSGGASTQFFMTAMNLLNEDETACFIDTGSWSTKAIKEAKFFGNVDVLASSKDKKYAYIPKDYTVPSHAKYLHLTSNNTIEGTQYHNWPQTEVPFVCDMSSDIFSRHIDLNRFSIIYAGAQKNLGPAGTTLVIVKKDVLGKVNRPLPSMLDYQSHIKKNSTFNTPPVFPIYVSMLTLRWIKSNGGLDSMEQRNKEKAEVVYNALDSTPVFIGAVAHEDRSLMNVTFTLENLDLEEAFLGACREADISGIKGHRSVGGFRASIYNAMPLSSVKALAEVMEDFAKKHG